MEQLFTQQELNIHIENIADQINKKHAGDETPTVFICLLNGGFMYFSDLVKKLYFNIECDFIRVKSYMDKVQGDIQITKDIESKIQGKHIYLIDDILDTGETIKYLINHFKFSKPKSISVSTLLTRESSPTLKIPTYCALTIKDEWVYGYGMDGFKGYYRNLPTVYKT
jgi:hypoxanthine phosphoribosyltransferase